VAPVRPMVHAVNIWIATALTAYSGHMFRSKIAGSASNQENQSCKHIDTGDTIIDTQLCNGKYRISAVKLRLVATKGILQCNFLTGNTYRPNRSG
jgi:hypothetical protein